MALVAQLSNIDLFAGEEFGLQRVSLEIESGRRYHLLFDHRDQLNCLFGILEGRYRPDRGVVTKAREYLCQSDRLLLGEKVYRRHAGGYLALESEPFTRLGGRRTAKRHLMEQIKAWHLRHFPIYKLHGEDKLRFVLCALAFQESGLILISELHKRPLDPPMQELFRQMLTQSEAAVVVASCADETSAEAEGWLKQLNYQGFDLRRG
ncbi:MAG: hypothetical protein RRB13_01725 [bacterium]|nr:hypothetical protein [bacterium]